MDATEANATAGPRPGVISIAIRERAALQAAYMPFLLGGGLFVPTPRPAQLGDELYLILSLLDEPGRFAVPGTVAWITPAGSTGRPQGLGIRFAPSEAAEQLRSRIEALLGPVDRQAHATHTA
jgi:type IV pilus assembly protein PilZ